jgi:hypothetical protein
MEIDSFGIFGHENRIWTVGDAAGEVIGNGLETCVDAIESKICSSVFDLDRDIVEALYRDKNGHAWSSSP